MKAEEQDDSYLKESINELRETDPELASILTDFALCDIPSKTPNIKMRERMIIILSTLIGSSSKEELKMVLSKAVGKILKPEEVREIAYQATAYLGLGRTYPMILIMNQVFREKDIELPLGNKSTTTKENRTLKGNEKQVEIFGEGMRDSFEKDDISYLLSSNCFGDYYTRGVLDNRDRELVTFFAISAQGGCEAQLIAHAKGNVNAGNTREYMREAILAALPFIGYPRTLNALSALDKA